MVTNWSIEPKARQPNSFATCVGTCRIFVDHADELYGVRFASELVIDAGMIASECTYADDGNGNGS